MIRLPAFHPASSDERARVTLSAAEDAHADADYLVLVLASCAIATFGLLENSAAVIIGAMIIAPLTRPIQSLAFSVVDGSPRLFRQSLVTLALGMGRAHEAHAPRSRSCLGSRRGRRVCEDQARPLEHDRRHRDRRRSNAAALRRGPILGLSRP